MRLVTTKCVLDHLDVCRETLRLMMRATPEDYSPLPWIKMGTPGRPLYRWRIDETLTEWAEQTSAWRQQVERPRRALLVPTKPTAKEGALTTKARSTARKRRRPDGELKMRAAGRSPLMAMNVVKRSD